MGTPRYPFAWQQGGIGSTTGVVGQIEEGGPGGGGDGEVRGGGGLGVADVDGGGLDGYFEACAAFAAAVAGLEPLKCCAAHRSPRRRSSRSLESSALRACVRSIAYFWVRI